MPIATDYLLHHLCIYDPASKETIWNFLRWHHGISCYRTGSTYHITDTGHADYLFLGCGSPFQFQLEAPPFQFEYERDWWAEYGRGMNHVCWVAGNARTAYDQLLADGAAVVQKFTEFPTYDGFVVADPAGTWVEVMEYTTPQGVPQFVACPVGLEGLRLFGAGLPVRDLGGMESWYVRALGLRKVFESVSGDQGIVYQSDRDYEAVERNIVLRLSTPYTPEERQKFERIGPLISAILYLANDLPGAWRKAEDAGLAPIGELATDPRTGALTAWIQEPNGNLLEVREPFEA